MKTRAIKSIFILALLFFTLPMTAQDWMEIQFKDGTYRKFYLKTVTEMVTTKYDAEGVMHDDYEYLRVVTTDDVFTYLLSDIDNISFTKYDEETAKHNFVEANTAVFDVLQVNQTLSEVEEHLDDIKNVECVEDAWSDGHELFVKIKGFGVVPFHFSHIADNEVDQTASDAKNIERIKAMLSQAKVNMSSEGKKLKAVIANQTHFDKAQGLVWQRSQLYYPLIEDFRNCGIDAKYIEKPTIDFFLNNSSDPVNDPHLYDYDIIILDTHGGYDETTDEHSFLTGEVLGVFSKKPEESELKDVVDNYNRLIEQYGANGDEINATFHDIYDLSENEDGTGTVFTKKWVYYPILKEKFFKNKVTGLFNNPHSIFFNCACQSLKGKNLHTAYSNDTQVPSSYSFANVFLEKNLGTYFGYNESVKRSAHASSYYYSNMMNGYSMDKAAYSLIDKDKVEQMTNQSAQNNYPSYLMRVPDLSNKEAGNVFMVSTYTNESDQTKVNQEYSQSQTVTVEGITTHLDDTVKDLKYGFRYKAVDIGQNPLDSWNPVELWKEEPSVEAELVPMTINSDKGNRLFKATLTDLEPNKTYVYRAYTYDGMNYNYGEPCAFTIKQGGNDIPSYTSCPDDHHPHLIDLGLPSGTKWACCNVGASKPEEYGGYYAWGETEEKSTCRWSNYIHCDGSYSACHDIGKDIAGTQYDAATVNWGSPWVMPNKDQMDELVNNCTSEWTTENDVYGRRFTGLNGASVFLPAACCRWYDVLYIPGSNGNYWSSTLNEKYPNVAYDLYFRSDRVNTSGSERAYGLSVRPVVKN